MADAAREHDTKLIQIGNSRGIRLPKALIQKYDLESTAIVMEETEHGILIRKRDSDLLSWEETYREMAQKDEKWEDLDIALSDGLDDVADRS